ncbi:MAG TPA: glycosyltransferase family 4 protein [Pyrinomonadaceae bacterium]
MRIAVVNWSRRKAGGTETYLGSILPGLARRGYSISLWHEIDRPVNREPIELPPGVPSWCVEHLGPKKALDALREWKPDLIYTHSLLTPGLEAETLRVAPAVFFAHAYYGTCISGTKTFKVPDMRPCGRRFGPACLAHYYPRRCGGLSPLTMLRLYRLQSQRLGLLHRYRAILTHSLHMHEEYVKHGLSPEKVHYLSYYAHSSSAHYEEAPEESRGRDSSGDAAAKSEADGRRRPPARLLFTGRMESLKGGHLFIESLQEVRDALSSPLLVTFAGDGPERARWERQAAEVVRRVDGIQVEFAGWVPREKMEDLYRECDLLVFPSVWPEPFGLAGPEAGLHGIPVAAFNVGGVPEWLVDGVNGYLAPGDPPTARGLAHAIIKCLCDEDSHRSLRRGAVKTAQQFSLDNHLSSLTKVFDRIAGGAPSLPEVSAAEECVVREGL